MNKIWIESKSSVQQTTDKNVPVAAAIALTSIGLLFRLQYITVKVPGQN